MTESGGSLIPEGPPQPRGENADAGAARFAELHAEIQKLADFVRDLTQRSERRYNERRMEPLDIRFKDMGRDTWFEEHERRREEYERRREEHDARYEEMRRDIERRLDALERRRKDESGNQQ